MRTAGSRWTIALEQSDEIDFALYVRDVLGIRGVQDQDLPPVDPAPTAGRSTSATDDRAAAEAWSSWWSNLLRMRRPGHGSVALLRPALPDLAAGLRAGADGGASGGAGLGPGRTRPRPDLTGGPG